LAGTILSTLYRLTGSYEAALVLADAFVPLVTSLCAYWLAASLLHTTSARLLLVVGLLFGQDLLSLGNLAVFSNPEISSSALRNLFGSYGATLVPSYETSYLSIFRTPEPQTSYAVFFIGLGLLIRILMDRTETSIGKLMAALCAANALLPFIYIPLSLPFLFLQAGVSVLLWIDDRRRTGVAVGVLTVIVAGAIVIAMQSRSEFVGTQVVVSRLPIITPSVLLGLIGILAWTIRFIRRPPPDALLWFCLVLFALPIVLCNQQILTNRMVTTTQWEWYTNYPLLALGAAILIKDCFSDFWREINAAPSLICWALVVCSLLVIAAAQGRAYRMWELLNLQSLAMTRALAEAGPRLPQHATLVLDVPSLAPLVAVRRNGDRNALLDYTNVLLDRITLLDTAEFKLSRHGEDLFEYWRRTGVTLDQARALLESEANNRNGFYLAFFFSVQDFRSPVTDNRGVKEKEIKQLIPEIIAHYAAYLTRSHTRFDNKDFVLITERPEQDIRKAIPRYRLTPLATGEAKGVVEGAYLQDKQPR
jgi:hypothetical protein